MAGVRAHAALVGARVRETTLGELVDRARRHGGYVGILVVILAVALFFPGSLPISRHLSPAGGNVASGSDTTPTAVAGETAERAAPAPASSARTTSSSDGVRFGPAAFPHGDRRTPSGGGTADGGDTSPDGSDCPGDEQIEQARAAQTALEEGVGRPFPVDLMTTLRDGACGQAGGSAATADLLVLGRLVPLDAPVLLATLAPVVAPACEHVRGAALLEALTTQSVSPALAGAVALCDAAGAASAPAAPAGVPPAFSPGVQVDELAPGLGPQRPGDLEEEVGGDRPVDPDVPSSLPRHPDLGRP